MQIYSHSYAANAGSGNGRPLQIDGEAAPALRALMSTFNNVEKQPCLMKAIH